MEALQSLLDVIARYPGWAMVFVALICFVDALLIVGLLLPSALLLIGAGALISIDALPLWPVLIAATAGAAAADIFNYWLGSRYLERWVAHPRMTRFADSVARSRVFFQRRGTIALLIGRLVGPTRPMAPMIAGAAQLSLVRFGLITAISCPLWVALYLLPGVALGASLQLAAEVATRLALLLVGGIALAAGLFWLANIVVRISGHHAERWLHGLLAWSARHRRLGWLPRWLADPRYPETPALLAVAALLLAIGWLALLLTWGPARDTPMAMDVFVHRQLAALHTPWGLEIARWIAHLGDLPVMLTTAAAAIITLAALGRGRAAGHALAALAFGSVIAFGLAQGLRIGDPSAYFTGAGGAGYGGADLVLACVVFGLLPLLLARPHDADGNLIYYRLALTLPVLIVAAQLYLGQQWLSIAAGALIVGGLWMLALGIGYRRHGIQPVPPRRFLPPLLLSFAVAVLVLKPVPLSLAEDGSVESLSTAQWWEDDWRALPLLRRQRVDHDDPLAVQWRADIEARDAALAAAGWAPAPPLTGRNLLLTLSTRSPAAALPVPPQPLGLQRPQAMFQRSAEDASARIVLRLWRAPARVDGTPVWLGSLSRLGERRLLGLVRLPYTDAVGLSPEPWLSDLTNTRSRRVPAVSLARHVPAPDPGLLLLQTPHPSNDSTQP